MEAERQKLIAEVAAAKKAVETIPVEAHDWSELETRRYKIDALLREAGWLLNSPNDREFEVRGMPSASGVGKVHAPRRWHTQSDAQEHRLWPICLTTRWD